MDLSIVIVSWNTRQMLSDCLASVREGLGDLKAEIWVVDNASEDGSPEMVARDFPEARVIVNAKNRGFAAANNQALAMATGRHVLLLNSDTLVHGDVLQRSVAWLDAHPEAGVMGPRVLNTDGTTQASTSRFPSLRHLALQTLGLTRIAAFDGYRMTGWDRRDTRAVEVVSGCAMFVRRAAMERVGLLDEAFFFYGEETDWCRRFADAGWQLVFAPVGEITHFGGGSVRRLNHKRDTMLTEATVRLHRKHGGFAAGLACWLLLAGFNLSRAIFWTLARAVRPGAADRARHFRRVVADLARTWPRSVAA